MDADLRASLVGGAAAGAAGLAAFVLVHAALLVPVWPLLWLGLPVALGGGALVGWCWRTLRAARPLAGWAYGGLAAALVLPVIAVTAALGPVAVDDSGRPLDSARMATTIAIPPLLGLVGGAAWTRRMWPSIALGLTGLVFALPFGGRLVTMRMAGAPLLFAASLLGILVLSGVVMGWTHGRLIRSAP